MIEALVQAALWGVMGAVTICTFVGSFLTLLLVATIITAPIIAIRKRLK